MHSKLFFGSKHKVFPWIFMILMGTFFYCLHAANPDGKKVSLSETSDIAKNKDTSVISNNKSGRQLIVYYFMSTYRCPSCIYIEKTTESIVKNVFASEVKTGRVVFKALNIDKPENKHFDKDYKLYAQSVILSDVLNGKEVRWANLNKVWELLNNDKSFKEYITKGIKGYLGE